MDAILGILFSDQVMACLCIIAAISAAAFGRRKRFWLPYVAGLSLMAIAMYFLILACDIEPISSSVDLRARLFRPGMFVLVVSLILSYLNGRLADLSFWLEDRFTWKSKS